jgi:hypothetical protein
VPHGAECRDGSRLFQFSPRSGDDETPDLAATAHEELHVRGLLPPDAPVATLPVGSSRPAASALTPTVHFVGIGGVGLAALARLALADVRALPARYAPSPLCAGFQGRRLEVFRVGGT